MKNLVLALVLSLPLPCFCQTAAKEPDALQSLLAEVHQLRLDIEGMTVASQRVQIALFQLQTADGAVARAATRFTEVHEKCAQSQQAQQNLAAQVQRLESPAIPGTISDAEKKEREDALAGTKMMVEQNNRAVASCEGMEAEASAALHTEQAKLAELQDKIQRLDKALEQLAAGK